MRKVIKFLLVNRLLILIVLCGAIVRLVGSNHIPPALNWDEVSHGYNAYSILKTGKDEWGENFPSIFRAYGDYKLPVYIYATVPRVAVFGLDEFAVRSTSALAGTLLISFTYLLVVELLNRGTTRNPSRNHAIALLAALFVAIEPWSLFLSRTAVEANLALFLIVAGVWFTLSGLSAKRWWFVLGAIFLGLSVWTYNSARIFVPMLLVALAVIYKKELFDLWKRNKKTIAYYLVPIALFFLPMFYQLANSVGQARYGAVQILDEGAVVQINTNRAVSNLPEPLPAFLYNKATYFAQGFFKNYVGYFSPNFLFFQGGSQYQFSVPGKGLFYPTEFVFVLIGLVWVIKKRSRESMLVLVWILLAPVAASLTREPQHALRSIVMMPILQIFVAIGLVVVWKWIRKKNFQFLFLTVYVVALLYFVEDYVRTYVSSYRTDYSWSWQYGYKEAISFVKDNYDNYDRIIMTKKYGEPHEFFLFYWPWDPEKYRNDPNLIRFHQSDWYWVDRFDKFYFVNDWQIPKTENGEWRMENGGEIPMSGKTLLITSPGNYPPAERAGPHGWKIVKTINFLDNKPVFDILEK